MKFSIIIPAHNAESYFRMALNSVKAQSFKDYELIVICDACNDDTEKIAHEYTEKVYAVDYHNEGKARNCGLDHAIGDWVLWIDDDDWFLHQFVLAQIAGVLSDDFDVLAFAFIFQHVGYAPPKGNDGKYWVAVWSKCWRRLFIGNTRFGETFPVDVGWHLRMMDKAPRIADWNMPIYYYNFMRPGSQTWKIERGKTK